MKEWTEYNKKVIQHQHLVDENQNPKTLQNFKNVNISSLANRSMEMSPQK
jgi:hypothetical protein